MSVLIPCVEGIDPATPRLRDFGSVLTPPGGGVEQRLNRLGNRFAIDISMSFMEGSEARQVVSRVLRAVTEGGLFPFPQDLATGGSGTPVVNGAGQQGSTLSIRGFASGYPIREGQFFSIIFAGRRYLHMVSSVDTVVGGSGAIALNITPMLRISPNDGATVEFETPYIEGFLGSGDRDWTIQVAAYRDVAFTISEAA